MSEIIETTADGRYRVCLEVVEDAENPRRDRVHLGYVITQKDSRYQDVDPDSGPLQYGWDRLWQRDDAVEIFIRWARIFHGAVVVEHTPAAGANSLWYLMPKDLAEVTDPAAYLQGEIAEYRGWADGEAFAYVIEEAADWVRRDGEQGSLTTWEEVDRLGTYYGFEDAQAAARSALADHLNTQTETETETEEG